jgi:hypothetical protein
MKVIIKLLKVVIKMMWKLGIIGWDDVFALAEQLSFDIDF